MGFKTIEEVQTLFENAGGNETNNNYFLGFRDVGKSSGMVAGMNNAYDALLINCTDKGLAMFYLAYKGLSLTNNIDKLLLNEDSYTFIANEQIENVSIKKLAPLNNKIKTVKIETTNGQVFPLQISVVEKGLPYHESGFAVFMEKYGN